MCACWTSRFPAVAMWGCGSCPRRWRTSFPRDGLWLRSFQDGGEKGYGLADVHGDSIESGWSAHSGVLFGLEAARIGGTSNDLSPLSGKANPDDHHSHALRTFRSVRPNGRKHNKHGINRLKPMFSVSKRRNIVRSFVASFRGDREVGCLINPCPTITL